MTLKTLFRFPITVIEYFFGFMFIVYYFIKYKLFGEEKIAVEPSTAEPEVNTSPEVDFKEKLISSEDSMRLLSAVENQQLKELKEHVYLLSLSLNSLIETSRQHQEFLVHIATLHEELLNQLDQGKVIMVKSGAVDDEKPVRQPQSPFDVATKKKQVLN
jgi:hypothetical protein